MQNALKITNITVLSHAECSQLKLTVKLSHSVFVVHNPPNCSNFVELFQSYKWTITLCTYSSHFSAKREQTEYNPGTINTTYGR